MTTRAVTKAVTCHTCIQCAYCDMWDRSCGNIDNARPNGERMRIDYDDAACQYFKPDRTDTESAK